MKLEISIYKSFRNGRLGCLRLYILNRERKDYSTKRRKITNFFYSIYVRKFQKLYDIFYIIVGKMYIKSITFTSVF